MATRSTIAKLNADNTITSIYCHWDGYPAHVGRILAQYYTDPIKVDQLFALGDLSILAEEIGEQQDFDNPTKGWTLAYGRDRGETDISALSHMDVDGWLTFRKGSGCEYGYLWDGTEWCPFDFYDIYKDEYV